MSKFENSVLKDICYHGTSSAPFTVLDKSKIEKNPEEGDAGYFGWGFYLTTDKEYAEQYGDDILSFYVDIENPFDFDDADYEELVEFLFKDSNKKLVSNLESTLYCIKQLGLGRGLEFETNNSEEIQQRCLDIYEEYKDSFDEDILLNDLKDLMIDLASDIGNWLNGLFFYFGRELFHYFTLNGYDGIIAQGGKEVVVYESKQLEPVKQEQEVKEDLDVDVLPETDWKAGASEYTQKIKLELDSNPDVSSWIVNTLYPQRKAALWYDDEYTIISFTYKDLLEVTIYDGGDLIIYPTDNDDDVIYYIDDLESWGVFTDEQLYAFLNDSIIDEGGTDELSTYFGFVIKPLKNNPNDDDYYAYDIGYDDFYDLDEILPGESIEWFFDTVIPEFIRDFPEYFKEDEEEKSVDEAVEKEVKKHITKSQVLKDVVNTFGYTDVDNLTDAMYILPNGKILDTKGDNEKSQHENIANYISSKYNYNDKAHDGSKFMADIGAIRVTPWIPAITVTSIGMTEKQEDTLYNILIKLKDKVSSESPLMISTVDGEQFIEYNKITNPEEITTSILGYQIFGLLKEKLNVKGAEMKFLKHING